METAIWRLVSIFETHTYHCVETPKSNALIARDNRVRAIAKHIFGLTQVNWNHDTDDWEIPTGQTSQPEVAKKLNQWINGPKSPGLSECHAGPDEFER